MEMAAVCVCVRVCVCKPGSTGLCVLSVPVCVRGSQTPSHVGVCRGNPVHYIHTYYSLDSPLRKQEF